MSGFPAYVMNAGMTHINKEGINMSHEAKKFELKGLEGLSESQISQHRDILYVGYVNKLNKI